MSTAISTNIFSANKLPNTRRNSSCVAINGKPASNVPAGQTNSQNVGFPNGNATGRISTKIISKKYFKRVSGRGKIFFGDGILFSNSCNKPNGHKNPQTARPNIKPIKITQPAA